VFHINGWTGLSLRVAFRNCLANATKKWKEQDKQCMSTHLRTCEADVSP